MEERYKKNIGSVITEESQEKILTKTFGIIGCGGNGGYIAEYLARLGAKKIIIYDGDRYEESNLNRQVFCNSETIGLYKVDAAFEELIKINPAIEYEIHAEYFGDKEEHAENLLQCDIIFWAADYTKNAENLVNAMLKIYEKKDIPTIITGVIKNGFHVSVFTKRSLSEFKKYCQNFISWFSLPEEMQVVSQPAYLCSLVASFSVSLIEKIWSKLPYRAFNKCFVFDIEKNEFSTSFTEGVL